ncbi:M23 family metallopeptidase [Chitinophagaceae bacterium MMS25-I14]
MKTTTRSLLNFIAAGAVTIIALSASAQDNAAPQYPQGYFQNPLHIPILLAGNFGECRPGHFHSGMDIKTKGVENEPVHAAADGYISRIKMDKGGFGHALYITHANGYTTLYAHLNDFVPAVQKYLRTQQYRQKKWNVDLQLAPDQFPVKQGEQIAWSGNTGGSTAPHLHFEIRDTKTEHPLNPQLFGFDVPDTRSPVPTTLAIYDRNRSVYEQTPKLIGLKKAAGNYVPADDTITVSSSVAGLGLDVNDYMTGSDNTIAFYTTEWYLDDQLQGRIRLNDIGYDETRYMLAYSDYKVKKNSGQWIQCLFRVPGNKLNHIYEQLSPNDGALNPKDGQVHTVHIDITDDAGNKSTVQFYIRSQNQNGRYYCPQQYKSSEPNSYKDQNIAFTMDENSLYDDICFHIDKKEDPRAFSDRFTIHAADVPVHHNFDLYIRPDKPIPFALRDKIAFVYNDGKTEEGTAAQKDDKGWYKCAVRDFGEYRLEADTTAPVITPVSKTAGNKTSILSFTVKDNMTSVRKFTGTLENGEWLLFEPRGDRFFYRFDDGKCSSGAHVLTLTAADENGNVRTLKYRFTR